MIAGSGDAGANGDSLTDRAWLEAYIERTHAVAADLGALFQRALAREVPSEIGLFRRDTASIRYLQRQRRRFPHPVLLFVYASRYDPAFADATLGPATRAAAATGGPGAREIFERKAAGLDRAFAALVEVADRRAGHAVAALLSSPAWARLPLVWEVPAEDPARTGFPRDAMWWLTFQYLCEIARAIVAYVGVTPLMLEELRHVRANPRLGRKLLCLDGALRLSGPGGEEDRPLADLPLLLARLEARARRPGAARAGGSGA